MKFISILCFLLFLQCSYVDAKVLKWFPFAPEKLNLTNFQLAIKNLKENMPIYVQNFLISVKMETYSIACNNSSDSESAIDCDDVDPDDLGCHDGNTVVVVFCYDSFFDRKNGLVRPQFQLNNLNNNVTKVCNSERDKADRMEMGERHGLGASVCVERLHGKHAVHTHVQLSFTNKSYTLPTMNLPTHRMKKKGDLFDAEGVIPLFSIILGVSNEVQTSNFWLPIARLLDSNGTVINNEPITFGKEKVSITPGTLYNIVDDNPLAFVFMDMMTMESGIISINNLTLFYDARIDSAILVEINGTMIEINGNDTEKNREIKSCKNKYTERECEILLEYKKRICAELWKCFSKQNLPPPEIMARLQVPAHLRTSTTKETVDEYFNRMTKCDDDDNFFLGDDADQLTPEIMYSRLEEARKRCSNSESEVHERGKREIHRKEKRWEIPIQYKFDLIKNT